MRLLPSLLLGLGLGLAVAPQVSGFTLTECYPSCTTFTAPFSGSAIDQKTPWSGQIAVDKFDSHGTRTLIGVNIKTIVYFNTTIFVTRTTNSSSFGGNVVPGVMLHMDLHSNSGLLGQYWGRWGDYAERSQTGQDVTGIADSTTWPNAPSLFVDYTYPFFDVIGAVDCSQGTNDPWTCGTNTALSLPLGPGQNPAGGANSGPVWGYYIPSADTTTPGWPQYWYGPVSQGMYVERISDLQQPTVGSSTVSQYFQQALEPTLDNEQKLTFDNTFPLNVEQQVGTTQTFNRFTESQAFNKSIQSTDNNGGVGKNITAQSMLALFDTASGGSNQILFDAAATGQYRATFTGGNAGVRQQTYAKVAVRVEYTYTCTLCGDPQFGGFQGQSFQVHGYPGSYFNLFSAPSFQMNGRFTYLATGHCKYSHTPCWTHPGTYIDDIAFVVDGLLVRVIAGPVGSGYTVLINNEPFHGHKLKHANESDARTRALKHAGDAREFVPTKFYDPNTKLTIHLKSPLEVTVRTDLVAFGIHNADHFFNVDSQLLIRPIMQMGRKASADHPDPVTGKPGFPSYPLHGFIGQTWANKEYPQNRQYQGETDDYLEPEPYSTESLFSQYQKHADQQFNTWDN